MSIPPILNKSSASYASTIELHENIAEANSSIIDTVDKLKLVFNKFYLVEFSKNQDPPLLRIYETKKWYEECRDSFPFNLSMPINDIKLNFVGSMGYNRKKNEIELGDYLVDKSLLKSKTIAKILSLDPENQISKIEYK